MKTWKAILPAISAIFCVVMATANQKADPISLHLAASGSTTFPPWVATEWKVKLDNAGEDAIPVGWASLFGRRSYKANLIFEVECPDGLLRRYNANGHSIKGRKGGSRVPDSLLSGDGIDVVALLNGVMSEARSAKEPNGSYRIYAGFRPVFLDCGNYCVRVAFTNGKEVFRSNAVAVTVRKPDVRETAAIKILKELADEGVGLNVSQQCHNSERVAISAIYKIEARLPELAGTAYGGQMRFKLVRHYLYSSLGLRDDRVAPEVRQRRKDNLVRMLREAYELDTNLPVSTADLLDGKEVRSLLAED
ncbi:MAG: hypothetical protein R3F33_11730 [Planctomycetota bacterium]